jgi:hypothetical protein
MAPELVLELLEILPDPSRRILIKTVEKENPDIAAQANWRHRTRELLARHQPPPTLSRFLGGY